MPFKKVGSKSVGKGLNTGRNRDTSLDTSVQEDRVQHAVYKYTNNTQTTLTLEPWVQSIRFSGIGMGGKGSNSGPGSPFGSGYSGKGGGGGAGQFVGYTTNTTNIMGQTLYIGVGDADNPRNTYVKTGSHGGTAIFELNKGNDGGASPGPGAGGAASGLYGDTAGGNGVGFLPGNPSPSYSPYPGTPATGAGGGGGSGQNSFGGYIGNGGNSTSPPAPVTPRVNDSNYWLKVNDTSYEVGIGTDEGTSNFGSSGGGDGGGMVLDGTAYGGGGGGGSAAAGQGPRGGRNGKGGCLIVELSSSNL